MSIYEYDEETTRQNIREYAYECGVADGKKEGEKEGEKKVNKLGALLAEAGRVADFLKSLSDPEFQQSLFIEFGLEKEKLSQ